MLSPDYIEAWLGIPLAIVLWLLVLAPIVRAMFHAPADPDPEYSDWDKRDGLPRADYAQEALERATRTG